MEKKMKICSICKKKFEGYGNNAEPVAKGVCCDKCNLMVVLKRIELLGGKKK